MRIGYARTSTLDQKAGFAAQLAELEAVGCDRIYREQVSSVAERPELTAAIDYLRDGDQLVVTKLDRLARSLRDLTGILDQVHAKAARLHVLNLGDIDPSSPIGKLILSVIGAIAAFEREMMLERQREGIDAAKAAGKYRGRKPKVPALTGEIHRLLGEGVPKAEIARRLGINRESVRRALRASREAGDEHASETATAAAD